MRRVAMLGSALGGLGLTTLFTFPFIEEKWIYAGSRPFQSSKFPTDNPVGLKHPGERNIPFEAVVLNTEDSKQIHGWLMLQPEPSLVATIVYFHSNTGNRGFRLPHIENFYRDLGCNIFIFDYRGYAENEDVPTEEGLMKDARAVMSFIKRDPNIDQQKVLLYGRSLGGAVGIYAASEFPDVWGLIVENTFTSVPNLVRDKYYLIGDVFSRILSNEWKSAARVKDVTCPILFISGRKDQLVPPHHMDQLYESATASCLKEFRSVEDGGHNNIRKIKDQQYQLWIKEFISKLSNNS